MPSNQAIDAAIAPPRVIMFTPGLDRERFQKATRSGADRCLIDLEDSVPLASKAVARERGIETLNEGTSACLVAMRINEIRSREFLHDMRALLACPATPAMVLLPMVRGADEIDIVRALFSDLDKHPLLFALIETPDAVENVDAIAARSDGLLFGAADLAALLGTQISWENMLYPRQRIAMAAARYGIAAIDTPCYDLSGPDLLVRECNGAKSLGFRGKAAVHPHQVSTIRELFSPSALERERATAIVDASDGNGGAIGKVDGQMIGPPFVKWAQKKLLEAQSQPR